VGRQEALFNNYDIANDSMVFERMESRMKISETDNGRVLQEQVDDLRRLLLAYRTGAVTEDHKE
jgi:fructose-1,6-bisphosphatase-3